jgi:hypothetical protein
MRPLLCRRPICFDQGLLGLKTIQSHLAILSSTGHSAVAQTDASDRSGVASEASLTLSRARVPDLEG